uniref:Uncharacterized protein n=1 Tax=Peromyscus maniculatus bairdii TaxID=230844 RepID=A0A8C8UCC9_PERMB
MLFLITLLMSSMLTEGRVLTQTHNESIISTDHKTNVKTGLYKVDCPCELNIKDTLESNLCAHHQYRTAFEDLTNANLHKLDRSTLLNSLRKCYDIIYPVKIVALVIHQSFHL